MKADLISAGIAIGSLFIFWAIWRLWERHYEKKKHVQEELERLHRYRTEIQLYDRWMASVPEVVLLLGNLRAHSEGHGRIGEHAEAHGRFCDVPELRARILELKAKP